MAVTARKSPYQHYLDVLQVLPVYQRVNVESLRGQAISYVWGWQDHAGRKDSAIAMDFAIAFGIHAAEYAAGQRGMRHNIADAFTRFCAGQPIADSDTCQHPPSQQVELRVSEDCRYGCKIYRCDGCYAQPVIHNPSYGCPSGN